VKLSYYQTMFLAELLDEPFDSAAISAIFYMRRRDIVAQGVSLYRSVASGLFHSTESDLAAYARFKVVPYDETAIAKWIDDLLESERAFEAMFVRCGLAPIPLVYEDLEAVPHRAISLMATMLGAQPPSAIPISQYRILRDEISIEWSTRFKKNCSSYVQRVNDQRSNITSL
jgi:LPS sulfotransferase NodH